MVACPPLFAPSASGIPRQGRPFLLPRRPLRAASRAQGKAAQPPRGKREQTPRAPGRKKTPLALLGSGQQAAPQTIGRACGSFLPHFCPIPPLPTRWDPPLDPRAPAHRLPVRGLVARAGRRGCISRWGRVPVIFGRSVPGGFRRVNAVLSRKRCSLSRKRYPTAQMPPPLCAPAASPVRGGPHRM